MSTVSAKVSYAHSATKWQLNGECVFGHLLDQWVMIGVAGE